MTSTNNNAIAVETTSATPVVVETPATPANDTIPAPPPVHVANDNATKRRMPLPGSLYSHERVDQMLITAGYDPEALRRSDRKDALWVAWAYKSKLYDRHDIAQVCSLSVKRVQHLMMELRFAAKPGTVVG